MKLQSSKLLRLAAMGAAGCALAQSIQAATVLTGSGLANNINVPAGHGSNAAGTPDITLLWSPVGPAAGSTATTWQSYNGWPSGDQVYQLDGPGSGYTGAVTYSVSFTPSSATIAAVLTSLTLNDWTGPATPALQNTTLNWSVVGSVSGTLGSATGLVVTNGTASQLDLNFQGVGGETLTLNLTPTGGAGSYFAVDNLSFDQVAVPEPSGAILAAAGLGALALRRRRK
jgi:MYXO-CTERM domain-containing protein